MDRWQIVLIVFCGVSLLQSVFLGSLIFVKDRLRRGAQFFIGVMLVGLAFRLIKSYFVFVPQTYPHWGIVAGGSGLWLAGPAFYGYTRLTLSIPLNEKEMLLHFLPSLLILLTGITEYVYYVGLLQFFLYFTYSIYLAKHRDHSVPRHFFILAACTGLILLCFVIQASQGGIRIYTVGLGAACSILYAINFFIARDANFFVPAGQKAKKLDAKLAAKIVSDITRLLSERKIYRNRGLKLAEIAREANYPAYLISQSINQQHQIRFNEFVNRFRVQEAMERLQRKFENDKIEVIAREVGFSSITSLYDAFRKETNVTPQVFRNQFNRQ